MPQTTILDPTYGITPSDWTTATRPASPELGQQGWNTTLQQYEIYTGNSIWKQITAAYYTASYLIVAGGGGGGYQQGGGGGGGGG